MRRAAGPEDFLVLIPCFNEEASVGGVIEEVWSVLPGAAILVADDCSRDSTRTVAGNLGAGVLGLPYHLGLGGCVQAGYKLAYELGFHFVIRVDGDGQHAAADIPRILETLKTKGCHMVIGSRFSTENGNRTSVPRSLGIWLFRMLLRPILGKPVHDPTSGFVGVNREALAVFSRSFPLEYPEIETLVVLKRKHFQFEEIACKMRPRRAGKSSITAWKSLYYIVHVLLGVFVNILKFEGGRGRK